MEDQIDYATALGSNGEKTFKHVMMKMVPDADGTNIGNFWNANQEQTITYIVPIPSYYMNKNKLSAVGFIQDNSI